MSLVHKLNITKEIKTPEDIIEFLVSFGAIDADFNGDNGSDYVSAAASAAGFSSDAEYLANEVVFHSSVNSKKYGIKAYVDEFAKRWRESDNYWCEIVIEISKLDIPDIFVIRNYKDWQGIYIGSVVATDKD